MDQLVQGLLEPDTLDSMATEGWVTQVEFNHPKGKEDQSTQGKQEVKAQVKVQAQQGE